LHTLGAELRRKKIMKKLIQLKERGQALVVIAIAAIALFAFAALAIDGSIVFSDRRHSQNASDTAVLAAALAKVENESKGINVDWHQAGLDRAKDNSYDDADPVTEVQVTLCTQDIVFSTGVRRTCTGLPAGAQLDQYVHVGIKSVVNLSLAQVLGWKTITNYTDAVSRATVPVTSSWFDGYAIAALHEGCQSPGDGDPFQLGGSAHVTITGAGVLVNASCPTQDSLVQSGTSSTMLTADSGTCVVGTADNTTGITPPPTEGCPAVDPSKFQMPAEPSCQNPGSVTDDNHDGVWIATPGYFNSTFPNAQGGQATIRVTKGVYCLNNGMNVNAGWSITTDLDNDDDHDAATEGALFYASGGDIIFNGGADVTLHAISQSTSSTFSSYWLNLLIYVPDTNEADIEISGNSGSSYTGTILAPTSHVQLLGNGGTVGLDSKIISDTVKISGSTTFDLTYNEQNNATTITNPGIALIK
jgi:Putative Flp pilus-assembly TadE/G-like